jgi:hypothetical protein
MIITSDTTWTKANIPYTLSAPVGIPIGVTLTIEAGITVNFGNYIQVNGTLMARGTPSENIVFNKGEIRFTPQSISWDEKIERWRHNRERSFSYGLTVYL